MGLSESTSARTGTIQGLLRAIAAGGDPGHQVATVLDAALQSCAGSAGIVVALGDDGLRTLAAAGDPGSALRSAAGVACRDRRPARHADDRSPGSVLAVPIRAGGTILGALAVAAAFTDLDHATLSVLADGLAVTLALAPAPTARATDLLDAVAVIGAAGGPGEAEDRLLDAAHALFGARGGCILHDATRITAVRGLDRAAVAAAVDAGLLDAGLGDDRAVLLSPVVARDLGRAGAAVVAVPLLGVARLLLVLPTPPDATHLTVLRSFGKAAAAALSAPALRREVQTARDALDACAAAVPSPVVVADPDGGLLVANPAAATLFRLSPLDVGQPVAGRLGNRRLEKALLGGDIPDGITLVDEDGRERVFRIVVGSGTAGRTVALDDVTSRSEAEAVKNDLVAVIGHELRTPVTVVKSALRTVLRQGPAIDGDMRAFTLDAMMRNVERLERLVEDLLFVASVADGHRALRRERVDVGETLQEMLRPRVELRVPSHRVELEADRGKLLHAVGHLVDNALKHSTAEVVVELHERTDTVEIAVVDRGIGIFSGDIPALFQRFRQLDGTSTRATGGAGLGLYVTRRIAEAHGGRVSCQSRLGQGSRFVLALPR